MGIKWIQKLTKKSLHYTLNGGKNDCMKFNEHQMSVEKYKEKFG